MTDFGRREGGGDMKKSTYDPNNDGVIALAQTEADMTTAVYGGIIAALQALAAAHKTQHEDGGSDEIDATGLAGIPVGALLGDTTEGRKLGYIRIYIEDGTNANTIKVQGWNSWNGAAIAQADNLGKGGSSGMWSLAAGGNILTISGDAFDGNMLVPVAILNKCTGTEWVQMYAEASGGGVALYCYDVTGATKGASVDLTNYVDTAGGAYIRMFLLHLRTA